LLQAAKEFPLLRDPGFETIALDYDEVGKAFGAFRCTTLPLRRG
jgi:N-dimethylarginine dimethylaminohydrolase